MPIEQGIRAPRRKEDWKNNTGILKEAHQNNVEVPRQTIQQREIKAEIVDLIDQGINSRRQILEEIDEEKEQIKQCLDELIKQENVLEVKHQ